MTTVSSSPQTSSPKAGKVPLAPVNVAKALTEGDKKLQAAYKAMATSRDAIAEARDKYKSKVLSFYGTLLAWRESAGDYKEFSKRLQEILSISTTQVDIYLGAARIAKELDLGKAYDGPLPSPSALAESRKTIHSDDPKKAKYGAYLKSRLEKGESIPGAQYIKGHGADLDNMVQLFLSDGSIGVDNLLIGIATMLRIASATDGRRGTCYLSLQKLARLSAEMAKTGVSFVIKISGEAKIEKHDIPAADPKAPPPNINPATVAAIEEQLEQAERDGKAQRAEGRQQTLDLGSGALVAGSDFIREGELGPDPEPPVEEMPGKDDGLDF